MKKIVVIIVAFCNIGLIATGSLDSSFGTDGRVTISFGGSNDQALATVFQPDGKIVVAGHSNASGDFEFGLARYNADGSLDSSFGTAGLVTT
ncbi:calcium-binding protein, partial [Candidatus Dependentiae bacterium]